MIVYETALTVVDSVVAGIPADIRPVREQI
jgi:hypothetical protein